MLQLEIPAEKNTSMNIMQMEISGSEETAPTRKIKKRRVKKDPAIVGEFEIKSSHSPRTDIEHDKDKKSFFSESQNMKKYME